MKITALVENTSCREDVGAEHGLSLWVETGNRKVLFDFGQTGLLTENARVLGKDLSQVDTGILSHGHYDHGGGLFRFLEANSQAPVYASDLCFGKFYNGPEKYIGLNPLLEGNPRIIPVPDRLSLGDGMTLYPGRLVPTPRRIRSEALNFRCRNLTIPDCFLHEQYLLVEEKGKRILFSGCSHRGILNIAEHFQPDILVGGFHFKNVDPVEDLRLLQNNGRALLDIPTTYYTCHCTGTAQYEILKDVMGDRLHYLSAGTEITL